MDRYLEQSRAVSGERNGTQHRAKAADGSAIELMNRFGHIVATPKTGDEPFTQQGRSIGSDLHQFWRWACSDLIGNAQRGILAEYIVGLALGCVADGVRVEWDASDLLTRGGVRVEVKSSAYLQSWKQEKLTAISFGIQPTSGWDAKTNTIAAERKRQADVYVFCVFKQTDQSAADPLNVDQWDFYVMSTQRLNSAFGEQKTVGLGSLLSRGPVKCVFSELANAVAVEAAAHMEP